MNFEKVYKLLDSGNKEDRIIGFYMLIQSSIFTIIRFFHIFGEKEKIDSYIYYNIPIKSLSHLEKQKTYIKGKQRISLDNKNIFLISKDWNESAFRTSSYIEIIEL